MDDGKIIWKERLTDVDDDYLIGISNKGIVKRAYKDMEDISAEIQSMDQEADVKVGEETVTVRFPLGDSKCTCPSRSICRHVIQAILTLRENVTAGNSSGPGKVVEEFPEPGRSVEGNATQLKETAGGIQPQAGEAVDPENFSEPEKAGKGKTAESGEVENGKAAGSGKSVERDAQEPGKHIEDKSSEFGEITEEKAVQREIPDVSAKVFREIEEYPIEVLKKTLGNRQFQKFASQVLSGIRPQMQYASVVTVRLPDRESGTEAVVKLLSPLEYSSCTCHKKELCVHKAAAILWCRLESGTLTKEELTEETAGELSYDMDKVKDAAGQMQLFLEELFGTGLSRISPDVLDHMERLAVISHNAGLAKFEGYFRGLFDSYDRYFKRKAAFKTEDLMGQITRLYRRVKLLQQAEESTEVRRYAGEFRAEYLPVGRLELIGIAMEHFSSQAGYAGETIYFLEQNTKKWYTYTNARPIFYDNSRKRKFTEKGQAPWGLGISLENLLRVRIRLIGAKCDERQRLSASQDTKGEIIGEQKLTISEIEDWYYRDFGELFSEQIGKRQRDWLARDSSKEAAELVFVQPESCEPADFSQTKQQLSLPLYDEEEREVTVEVTYSKEESRTIRYLERISEKKLPCFVGKLYFRDGKMCMYPLAVLDELT